MFVKRTRTIRRAPENFTKHVTLENTKNFFVMSHESIMTLKLYIVAGNPIENFHPALKRQSDRFFLPREIAPCIL